MDMSGITYIFWTVVAFVFAVGIGIGYLVG